MYLYIVGIASNSAAAGKFITVVVSCIYIYIYLFFIHCFASVFISINLFIIAIILCLVVANVLYDPGSLDPVCDNWIMSAVDPIPIGEVNGNITSSFIDLNIQHRIHVWLRETTGGGEESQIARNDGLLKTIMSIAGITEFLRNKKADTTVTKRPDFTALFGGVPVFIDEEKEGDNVAEAVDDIINKFKWIPNLHRLPFFIGIAFSFSHMRIVQLNRDAQPTVIFAHSISTFQDRLSVLQPAVNVARVLKHFVDTDMITPAGLSMGKWHSRPCGKQIKISLQGVEVKCHNQAKYKLLKQFYDVCKDVPYLERLCEASNDDKKLSLRPLGLPVKPTTDIQFRQSIKCVSIALFGIHGCGYVHTDVRWSNIVLLDTGDWMLIDCYEVCKLDNEDGLRDLAIARGQLDRSWGCCDDISQLVKLGGDLSFRPQEEFTKAFKALVVSKGTTVIEIGSLCDNEVDV